MLSIGSAVSYGITGGTGAGGGIFGPPAPPRSPSAPTPAQKAIADANAIALRAKTIADANAYAASVAKNNPIMRAVAPMTAATSLATSRKLAASIPIAKAPRSIWGGGAEGGGGGGGGNAPSSMPSDASVGTTPDATDQGVDYSGTGYTPNRGGNIYGGGYYGGGGAPPASSGGGFSGGDGGGGAWQSQSGQAPGAVDPSLVQSAGAGDAPTPKNAASVSGSIGKDDWPWIVGIGVAAVGAILFMRSRKG